MPSKILKLGRFTFVTMVTRAVVSGGAEGALAPPEFGNSVNPIPTRY